MISRIIVAVSVGALGLMLFGLACTAPESDGRTIYEDKPTLYCVYYEVEDISLRYVHLYDSIHASLGSFYEGNVCVK